MNLILCEADECTVDNEDVMVLKLEAKDRRSVHMRTILKIGSGDTVRVGVIGGRMFDADVDVQDETFVLTLRSSKQRLVSCECDEDISLILASPRPKVLGRLFPVFSQQGVKNVAICSPSRVEKCYWGSHLLKPDFYRPALLKGLEQAAVSTRVPNVTVDSRPLEQFLKRIDDEFPVSNYIRVLAHPQKDSHLSEFVFDETVQRLKTARGTEVVVAIGPEGGWLDFEIDTLVNKHGFVCASFSPRILSTDVAIVSVVSIVSDVLRKAKQSVNYTKQ